VTFMNENNTSYQQRGRFVDVPLWIFVVIASLFFLILFSSTMGIAEEKAAGGLDKSSRKKRLPKTQQMNGSAIRKKVNKKPEIMPAKKAVPKPVATRAQEKEATALLQQTASMARSASTYNLLTVGARIDINYLAGDPVFQGFSLPSVRLEAAGEVDNRLAYVLAIGQTREFGSVLLPQLIPVEAYVDFTFVGERNNDALARLAVRVGMYTPFFNPWWSPDIGETFLPDYNETHKRFFVSRDQGAQLVYTSPDGLFEAASGFFNGNGIFSQNTNSAKTFNGYLRGHFYLLDSDISIGAGYINVAQSSKGSVNFKRNWIVDGFIDIQTSWLHLMGDVFYADFRSNNSTDEPFSISVAMLLHLYDSMSFFVRYESLSEQAGGSTNIKHYQVGPYFQIQEHLQVYLLYTHLDESGGIRDIFEFRLRLMAI